jgi:hypothetical protein
VLIIFKNSLAIIAVPAGVLRNQLTGPGVDRLVWDAFEYCSLSS